MNDRDKSLNVLKTRTNLPWGIFFFLMAVFYFAQPFDLIYSRRYLTGDQDLENVLTNIERIKGGSMERRCALFALASFALIALFRGKVRDLRINGLLCHVMLFFLAWSCLSVLWADDVPLTFRRLLVLGSLCIGAWAIAGRFSLRDIMIFAFLSGSFTLLLGIVCEIGLGTFLPLHNGYRFGGEMNPIFQGYSCGMLIIASLALAKTSKRGSNLHLAVAFAGAFFLLLTRSRGPLAGFIIAATGFFILVRTRFPKVLYLCIPIIAGISLYFMLGDDLFVYLRRAILLGRTDSNTSTLSGRIPLWQECFEYVLRRPMLGYGYDSFWTPANYMAISKSADFPVADVHNAFLDLLLGTGFPGAISFTLILLLASSRAIHLYKTLRNPEYAFGLAILLLFSVNVFLVAIHLHPYIPSFVTMIILVKLGFQKTCPNLGRQNDDRTTCRLLDKDDRHGLTEEAQNRPRKGLGGRERNFPSSIHQRYSR